MAQSTTAKARDAVERLKPGEHELTPTAKAIAAAATAAVAGGLAAALKALVEHRAADGDEEAEQEQDRQPDAEHEPAEAREQREDEDQEQEQENAQAQEQEPQASEGREAQDERPQEQQADDGDRPRQTPNGGAARVVEAGKSELEALLGQPVESVSGFSRSDDGWCVTYEVVELRRIPDSSDVLSSYAVVLDDDGDLITMERKHRYRRAQVDDG